MLIRKGMIAIWARTNPWGARDGLPREPPFLVAYALMGAGIVARCSGVTVFNIPMIVTGLMNGSPSVSMTEYKMRLTYMGLGLSPLCEPAEHPVTRPFMPRRRSCTAGESCC